MAQGISMQALERAVRVINGIITRTTQATGEAGAPRRTKAKWVRISARGKGKAPVRQSGAAGKALAAYLALPVEQYSLLDPSWIEREPGAGATFCLKAPLRGLTGVDLEPRIWVTVVPADGAVTFSSERASLGDPALDARFSLSLASTLSFTEQAGPGQQPPAEDPTAAAPPAPAEAQPPAAAAEDTSEIRQHRHTGHDRMAAAASARVCAQSEASLRALRAAEGQPDQAQLTGRRAHLKAAVRVDMRVLLGPPLTAVPAFLLSYTGGLVATALLQALIPILLDLLARDYERWAAGEGRIDSAPAHSSGSGPARDPVMLSLEL